MEAVQQHWQVLCRSCQDYTGSNNVFNGNSRAEATTYSTETQERKQYTTFKEAQQHLQEQQKAWKQTFKSSRKHGSGPSRAAESMEADLQEQQKAWKRTLKSGRKHETDTQERRTIILEFTEQVS
jgi:fumarate hydratase class II